MVVDNTKTIFHKAYSEKFYTLVYAFAFTINFMCNYTPKAKTQPHYLL